MKNVLNSVIWVKLLLLVMCCNVACDFENNAPKDDDEPRLPENPVENPANPSSVVKVLSQSIEENAVLDAERVDEIILNYSDEIHIVEPIYITLNDRVVEGVSVNDSSLCIPLELEPAQRYLLLVKGESLSAKNGGKVQSHSINFSTRYTANLSKVDSELCTRDAIGSAQQVYSYMLSRYGTKTLSGVKESAINSVEHKKMIYSYTQYYPVISCYDFCNIHSSDYNDVSILNKHYSDGGIVAFQWNWKVPSKENEAVESYSLDNDFSISKALIKGTWENTFIENELKLVAGYMMTLQRAGNVVLFNPMCIAQSHWWGKKGAPYFKELWKLVYDRMVYRYGLKNLIWVWSVGSENMQKDEIEEWYPGNQYVDIVGTEIFDANTNSKLSRFLLLNEAIEGRKMIAITLCGNIPDMEKCHNEGDTWLYFVVANDGSETLNTSDYWQKLLKSGYMEVLQ